MCIGGLFVVLMFSGKYFNVCSGSPLSVDGYSVDTHEVEPNRQRCHTTEHIIVARYCHAQNKLTD